MSELLHGAMLFGALSGAACTATARRTALDLAASVAMLLAMTDMALTRLVPPLAWTAVLVGLGVTLGIRLRIDRGAHDPRIPAPRLGHQHPLHRALAFIVGGWAFAAPAAAADAASASHAHVGDLAFVAAAVAMTVFGGCLVVQELRTGPGAGNRIRHAVEAASMTLMLAAMAVPGVVATLV